MDRNCQGGASKSNIKILVRSFSPAGGQSHGGVNDTARAAIHPPE